MPVIADNGIVNTNDPPPAYSRRRFGEAVLCAASLAGLPSGPAIAQAPSDPSKRILPIRGTYSSPVPFWRTGARLDDYGINAIFVHGQSITDEMFSRATREGAAVYAEFATLNGKGYVEQHPEAWPVNERGERAPAATWFLGACPTEPGFRAYRQKLLEDLLDRFALAGVWMDYFHWHAQFEERHPILPETCFCPSCLSQFEQATGLRTPAGDTTAKASWILTNHDPAWRNWRASVLVEWARIIRAVLRSRRPDALLGVYHCPWRDTEFDGALRRNLGIDFGLLAPEIDVFSPMVYHARMGRKPEWVRESIEWISNHLPGSVRIWPIVQAHSSPGPISATEFQQVMRNGSAGRATGLQMFTIGAVAEDPAKLAVLQRLYREWSPAR